MQAAFDGETAEGAWPALLDKLRRSPQAVDLWCDYALLTTELRRHARGRVRIPGTTPAATGFALARRRRHRFVAVLATAAAVLAVVAVALSMVFVRNAHAARCAVVFAAGTQVGGAAGPTTMLGRGQSLELRQGAAKLVFDCGAEALVEAPARLRLVAPRHLALPLGRARFHVPRAARGFTVTAGSAAIVDLGAAFGIDSLPAHQLLEVHVFDGQVEATARGRTTTLAAGRAARLDVLGSWHGMPAEPDRFLQELPGGLPQVTFRFDELAGGVTPAASNLPAGRAPAKVVTERALATAGVRLVRGVRGSALEFDGSPAWLEHPWHGIGADAPRTVGVWLRLPLGFRTTTSPPLVLWGDRSPGLNAKFKLAVASPAPDRTVVRVSFGEWHADGGVDLADGRWHHLALVYRGNHPTGEPDLAAFIDGRSEPLSLVRESRQPISTRTSGPRVMPLTIGRYELPPDPAHRDDRFLRGAIDELTIVAGALAEEEIRALAHPGGKPP